VAKGEKLMPHALASDVGGGMSFSPFATMRAAYVAARSNARIGVDDVTPLPLHKTGVSLSAQHLWWLHTAAAASGLGLCQDIGGLQISQEADFIVLNPKATPLLARQTAQAADLDAYLFAFIMHGDDRCVEAVQVA
jgi:guanine deaminase